MKRIYKNLTLNVHSMTSQVSLSAKRGSTLRGLVVTLVDNGKIYEIPDKCYAIFSAQKSDGTFVSDPCVIQDNRIIYDYSEHLVEVVGKVECDITLYGSGSERLTSPRFYMFVYETVQGGYTSDVVSSDSFTVLNDLIENAKEAIENVNGAAENINAAIAEANEATEAARASVVNIKKTEDGKLQLLDADGNVIDTVDVSYMDNDTIYRYDNGVLRVVGIKEINADETFRMWIGTNAEYLALTETDDNTFYWITDDATFDDVVRAINALNETVIDIEEALKSGELVVKKASKADNATTATTATTADGAPSKGTYTSDTTAASGMAFAFANTNGFGIKGKKDYFKLWDRQNSEGEYSTALVPSTHIKQDLGATDRKFDNVWTDKINGSKEFGKRLLWDYYNPKFENDIFIVSERITTAKRDINLSTHGKFHTTNLANKFLIIELMESENQGSLGEYADMPRGGYKYFRTNPFKLTQVGAQGSEYTETIDGIKFTFALKNSSTITVSATEQDEIANWGYYINKIYEEV